MKANIIEKNFKETLDIIADLGMTAGEIKNNEKLYNELAVEALEYFSKVALLSLRNRNAINYTGIEFDEFLNDVVMHFLNKLNEVIACPEASRIPFIINMTNNKVIDKVRAWSRIYGPTVFPDELTWGLIADKHNIEQEYENKEMAKIVLSTLNKIEPFDAVVFIATKVLEWKTATLAEKFKSNGYSKTMIEVLCDVMNMFNVETTTFKNILTKNREYDYMISQKCKDDLTAHISRRSYIAKTEVKKIMKKDFNPDNALK